MPDPEEYGLFDFFLIVTSGFLQHCGSAGNGCVQLAGTLASRYAGSRVRVELRSYDDDMDALAELIYRWGPKMGSGKQPHVLNAAYSWGAGKALPTLAARLLARGIDMEQAVLCDPVYHGNWDCWRAMLTQTCLGREVTIELPPNVGHVRWSRQYVNRPAGHRPVATGRFTKIDEPKIVHARHQAMDNCHVFHDQTFEAAEELFTDPSDGAIV